MQRTSFLISVLALSSFTVAIPGCAGGVDPAVSQSAIVGGTKDTGDPAVVLVFAQKPGSQLGSLCTGEVVSPHVVLTAAHCVDPATVGAGAQFTIFLGTDFNDQAQLTSNNFMDVVSTDFDPAFNTNSLTAGHDVGVVVTKKAFNITPLPVNQDPIDATNIGATLRLIGFGITSTKPADQNSSGVKRQVSSTLQLYNSVQIAYGDATHNTCEGDSGGPALMMKNGTEVIVGTTSYGDQNCQQGGVDTRVDTYWDSFIKPHIIAADGSVSTGTGSTVVDMATGTSSQGGTTDGGVIASGSVKVGGDCTDSSQCGSGICTNGGHRFCTAACVLADEGKDASTGAICPSGTHCGEVGTSPFCLLDSSGCSATTRSPSASSAAALPAAFLLLCGLWLRRRRTLARGRV